MMNLVRIGKRVINMDVVAQVFDEEVAVTLYFISAPNSDVEFVRLRGQEADAFRRWLRTHTTDVLDTRPRYVNSVS